MHRSALESLPPDVGSRPHRVLSVRGGGRSRPLNVGLDAAQGDFVCFLDDDDLARPNWFGAFAAAAREAPTTVIRAVTETQEWTTDGSAEPSRPTGSIETPFAPTFDLLAHMSGNSTPICSIAVPRASIERFGARFDESLSVFEDWEFLVRVAMLVGVTSIPEATTLYRRLDRGNAHSARRRDLAPHPRGGDRPALGQARAASRRRRPPTGEQPLRAGRRVTIQSRAAHGPSRDRRSHTVASSLAPRLLRPGGTSGAPPSCRRDPAQSMTRTITFVTPRYGKDVVGGAEQGARSLATRLAADGWTVRVLTSCARSHLTWDDEYQPGETVEEGVQVLRCPVDRPRDPGFDSLSDRLLPGARNVDEAAAWDWIDRQGPCSQTLLEAIAGVDEGILAFYPYLYQPTARGIGLARVPSVLHAACHREPPLDLPVFRSVFGSAGALAHHTRAEQDLVAERFPATGAIPQAVVGLPVEMDGPVVRLPPRTPGVTVLGPIPQEHTFGLLAAADALINPSPHESFSIVVIEAMLVGTPVLVNGRCPPLREHCENSGAGLWYAGIADFHAALRRIADDPRLRAAMRSGSRLRRALLLMALRPGALRAPPGSNRLRGRADSRNESNTTFSLRRHEGGAGPASYPTSPRSVPARQS